VKGRNMAKDNEKKGGKLRYIILAIVIICAAYYVGKNVLYRTSPSQNAARTASISVVNEMEENVKEMGFEEAQRRIQERSQENIAKLDGNNKMVAVIGGFLGLENRFSEGYETYCQSKGLSAMPALKRNVMERNSEVHSKAVAILESIGITEAEVVKQIIDPMKPQMQKVIDIELTSVAEDNGQSVKDLCETLEATADNNVGLEISAQRPDIIKIIMDYEI
jgi:hypothetical protein